MRTNILRALKQSVAFIAMGAVTLGAWAEESAWPNGVNGTWRFVVLGDHRGDNKAFAWYIDDAGKKITNGYTDGGITKAALIKLASAVKTEGADFALNVGDLATKWQPAILAKDADTLMTEELNEWRAIWLENSGHLPIFPVRGNQEYSAPTNTWTAWLATMPGISGLTRTGPEGALSYAFNYKNCLFVAVDEYVGAISSDSPTISPETRTWLANLFAVSDQPHVFAYGHAPAYEVWDSKAKNGPFTGMKDGLPSPSALDGTGKILPPLLDETAITTIRNAFWDLLSGEKSATYFCGHDHLYARGVAKSSSGTTVRQVIIGNGGAPAATVFPDAYAKELNSENELKRYDPFVESDIPSRAQINNFGSSRITCESFDNNTARIGYVVVEIHGAYASATYKALTSEGFVPIESWSWKSRIENPQPVAQPTVATE